MEYAIEMKGITKRFPGVLANDAISLHVKKQEIHCLLGENGSGKTTLMNILFGIYKMDKGEILINGKKADIRSPKDASDLGIGMVHQHFMLFNQNTVLENIIVGEERTPLFLNYGKSRREIQQIIDKYEFQIDLDEKVCNLSVGMKQRVEVLKVLYRGVDIIIFDEPTAVLTPQESDMLMQIILNLRQSGKTIIYISHKLSETMSIGDRITVLRKGAVVASLDCSKTTPAELAHHMVGKDVNSELVRQNQDFGAEALSVQNVPLCPGRSACSLTVHSGEILGIAGVDGNGQLELEKIIMGILQPKEGRLFLKGKEITGMPTIDRKMAGIVYIPSDRFDLAMLPNQSLSKNFLLGNHERGKFTHRGLIDWEALEHYSEQIIQEYNVKASSTGQTIKTLSGGNQQKAILGREISQQPCLILAAHPTRGLDIGAIEFVHKVLLQKRSEGCAILLISAELSEIMALSDRIAVMYEGEIVANDLARQFTRDKLGLLMAGKKEDGNDVSETV
jgi:ABC-type uncharacterized transport system ATPase subunit